MSLKKTLICSAVIGTFALTGCNLGDPYENSLGQQPAGGGNTNTSSANSTAPQVTNTQANIGLFKLPQGTDTAALDQSLKGILLDAAAAKFSGFTVSEPKTKALPAGTTPAEITNGYLGLIRKALTDAGKLDGSIVTLLESGYKTSAGFTAYSMTLAMKLVSAETLSGVRNLLLQSFTSQVLTSLPATAGNIVQDVRFVLTVLEDAGRYIVLIGAADVADFSTVGQQFGDFQQGYLVSSAVAKTIQASQSFNSVAGGNKSDILWVIDNSGSMGEEQANLAQGIGSFFDVLASSGVDYHLGVARTGKQGQLLCAQLAPLSNSQKWIEPGTPNGRTEWSGAGGSSTGGIARPGTSGSSTETGLYCGRSVYELVENQGFDRTDAKDIIVFVSDEPDREAHPTSGGSNPSEAPSGYTKRNLADYEAYYTSTKPVTAFAIVGTEKPDGSEFTCSGQGGSASGGRDYGRIVTLTNGSRSSICAASADWNVMFQQIALSAAGGASQFNLANIPIPALVTVTRNGTAVLRDTSRTNGFDVVITQAGASLVFFGGALPKAGDVIAVTYEHLS